MAEQPPPAANPVHLFKDGTIICPAAQSASPNHVSASTAPGANTRTYKFVRTPVGRKSAHRTIYEKQLN